MYPQGVLVSSRDGSAAAHERERHRSGLRHDGRSGRDRAPPFPPGAPLSLLLRRLPQQVRGRPCQVSWLECRPRGGRVRQHNPSKPHSCRRHLYLPDAPADPAGRTRTLPDLRHGAGTGSGGRRGRPQSRADRHDAAVLGWPRARPAGAGARDWRTPDPLAHVAEPRTIELDRARDRHPGRAVGGLAVLPARLAVGREPQPQHVHPDRDGDRRRLDLQRGRNARA